MSSTAPTVTVSLQTNFASVTTRRSFTSPPINFDFEGEKERRGKQGGSEMKRAKAKREERIEELEAKEMMRFLRLWTGLRWTLM